LIGPSDEREFALVLACGRSARTATAATHNDQLSTELLIDGEDLVRDPGTYLYTPLAGRRNEYRSVPAHFAQRVAGREPGRLDLGLFQLGDEARPAALYFGPEVFRRVAVLDEAVVVTDGSSLELTAAYSPRPFSPGQGLRG
jgi:Heparinase II/III-like protein